MNEPIVDESKSWARVLARISILAAMLCLSMNCVFNQLNPKSTSADVMFWSRAVGTLSLAVVVAGIVCGLVAAIQSARSRATDTLVMAIAGLVLNVGIIGVTIWVLWIISQSRDIIPAS